MSAKLCNCKEPQRGPLTSWSDISHYYYQHLPGLKGPPDEEPRWLFRGDSPRPNRLRKEGAGRLLPSQYRILRAAFKSRLDKAFEEFDIKRGDDRHAIEWGLMRTFRRKAHLHTGQRGEDWLERLGLMAHYEAPHRMLDWNYSFFNALYFAVNSCYNEGDCIVWALNKRWLNKQARKLEDIILERMDSSLCYEKTSRMRAYRVSKSPRFDTKAVHFLMLTNDISGIYPVTPYYQNERLSIQQGTFICAGTISHTWGENLRTVLLEDADEQPLIKIPIKLETVQRKEVLRELHSMNISQATLFPDLGGFAQSLRMRLADPETIKQHVPPLHCLEI